jgi:peroxisomal 3,2-trans-enoyl-CoA isomerase
MSYQTIETELIDGILILRHNRETNLNARNSQMYVEIMAALQHASADEEIQAVVLTARGRYFCAGMDFNNDPTLAYTPLPEDDETVRAIKIGFPEADRDDVTTWPAVKFIEAFINFDKLLIGAVNGPAIGEGFSSLMHCDIIYAADTAYFWAPFARAGVAPEFCSSRLFAERLGYTAANAAIYLGQKISAEAAKDMGLVWEVLPAGNEFEANVLARLKDGLALSGPPELRRKTLQQYKTLVYPEQRRADLVRISHEEFKLIAQRGRSGDTKAVQAFYQQSLPGRKNQT